MRWLFTTPAKVDRARLVAAIRDAEARTSGEIHVLIARHRAADPMAAARRHFERLGLSRPDHRHGILLFVAPRSRNFAVLGDRDAHAQAGDALWQELAAAMGTEFKRGDFTAGLLAGIARAGQLLARHFPRSPDQTGAPDAKVEDVD